MKINSLIKLITSVNFKISNQQQNISVRQIIVKIKGLIPLDLFSELKRVNI